MLRIKVRLQTQDVKGRFKGGWDCLRRTLKREGAFGLYKGLTPPLIGAALIDSCMIGSYTLCRDQLARYAHRDANTEYSIQALAGLGNFNNK